jgi:hypothetical protein
VNPLRVVPLAIAFALGLTVAGGVSAVATAKSSSVKVCANSRGYVVAAKTAKCPTGSHTVTIAKRGPKGAAGTPGKPGNDGVNGYSVAYAGKPTIDGETDLTGGYAVVSRFASVPAGRYVGSYQANLTNDSSFANATCHFAPGGDVYAFLSPDADIAVPAGETLDLSGTGTFALSATTEVDLVCTSSGSEMTVDNSTDALVRVNAVVQSN